MRFKFVSDIASKAGTTALALCLVAGNAVAGSHCASPQEMTALRVAALRQQLMVAALTCHQASSFNRFVISYQQELRKSDKALLRFFARRDGGRGDEGYNAYKTKMANDSSLRSLNDPWFCGQAHEALSAALSRNLTLDQLAAEKARPIDTGFESCMADDSISPASRAAAPDVPSRHRDMLETTPVNAIPNSGQTGALSSQPEREARLDPKPVMAAPAEAATPGEQADWTGDDTDGNTNDMYAYNQPYSDPAPGSAYDPYGPRSWYDAPRSMQQVQGPDGLWYLVPADGR